MPQEWYDRHFEVFGSHPPGHRPFRNAILVDRNDSPRHGYRAVHLVVMDHVAPYEVQIRTRLQNRWAQLSERLDDRFPGTKYGQGPPALQEVLRELSDETAEVELDYAKAKSLGEDSHPIYTLHLFWLKKLA